VAPIDLYIVGSVAVSVDGTRLGKGKDGKKRGKLFLRSLLPTDVGNGTDA
jgi:hypothetical protein